MWRLPQTKAPRSPPHSSSLSLHMVTGRPAIANYTHNPVCEVSQKPQSPLTRSRLTLYHITETTNTQTPARACVCVCVQTACPPLVTQPLLLCSCLAHSEVLAHLDWLWKTYLRATKITGWQSRRHMVFSSRCESKVKILLEAYATQINRVVSVYFYAVIFAVA